MENRTRALRRQSGVATTDISARAALIGGALIVAFKLWLSHSEEICGSATYHDAFWFVRAARDWYWGAEYNWTAFVRPPAYPLWLAAIHELGIRQRLAIDLLQMSGFGLLVFGLARAGVSRRVSVLAFAAACFHPGSFWQNNYTMADPFYAAILPMAVGCLLLTIFSGRIVAAAGAGFLLGVLWLTREESVLIALLLAAFVAIALLHWQGRDGSWILALRRVIVPSAAVVGSFAALVLLVYAVNNRTFSAFAKSEMSAPSYARALGALIRIDAGGTQRYVPVTSAALERAFAVSPTFARLRREFAEGAGVAWRSETLTQQGVRDEIGINYLMWALRHAAANVGVHESAREAEKFYNRMAREIENACADGRIQCRTVWASFIGPNLWRNAHQLPASFADVLGVFVQRYEVQPLRDDELLTAEERALYDAISHRRPLDTVGPASAPLATAIKNVLGAVHRYLVLLLALFGAAAAAILIAKRKVCIVDSTVAALLLVFIAIISRVGLFTVIDATSWPVAYERFLFPVMPMTSVFLLVLIAKAAATFRQKRSGDIPVADV